MAPDPSFTTAAATAHNLVAHARLCRQVAALTWSERLARELEQMAEACTRLAAALDAGDSRHRPH